MNLNTLIKKIKAEFPYEWSVPVNLEFGILTSNEAFKQAKIKGQNPLLIAQELSQEITEFIQKESLNLEVKTKGPYINLDTLPEFFGYKLTAQSHFIFDKIEKKVLLDYVSPNVAKPLHVGHLRGANIGESLRRILNLKYQKVITENYWGDWGVQFGILLWGFKQIKVKGKINLVFEGKDQVLNFSDYESSKLDFLLKVYIWSNQVKDQFENWDDLVRQEFLDLENGNQENINLWKDFIEVSKLEARQVLEKLNVADHELHLGESYYLPKAWQLAEFLDKNNLWQKEGKARYFDFEKLSKTTKIKNHRLDFKEIKDGRMYPISSTGYTSYGLRDLAARLVWSDDYDTDLMITIVGSEQKHHFQQFITILNYLSFRSDFEDFVGKKTNSRLNSNHIINVHFGFLTLPEGKMSTRKGQILRAKDVIDQVVEYSKQVLIQKSSEVDDLEKTAEKIAIASLKWFDLARDMANDIVLDLSKITSFEGNTGVYQLYTVVRLNSILDKNNFNPNQTNFDPTKLSSEEQKILKQTIVLPRVIEKILETYKPHLLTSHIYELTTAINSWYSNNSVSSEKDPQRKASMLVFCNYLREHLVNCLDLLAIETVDKL